MLLVLAVAELAARLWITSPSVTSPDARYGWVYLPRVRIVHSSEGWAVNRTNSLGMPDDELRSPRPPIRAVLLGDSFAEALQIPRRENCESVAERLVPGLEIVNTSYSGRSPVQYADWLEDYAARLAPDLVIVQLWDEDLDQVAGPASAARMAEVARAGHTPPPPPPPQGAAQRILRGVVRGSSLAFSAWWRFRQVAFDERDALKARLHPRPADPRDASSADHPGLDSIMDSLHRRIAARSRRLIYLYVPTLDYVLPGCPTHDRRAADFYHRFALRNHVRLVDPSAAMRAEFARTGHPLQGFANSVLGGGHPNADGHRVIGEQLARAIREELR